MSIKKYAFLTLLGTALTLGSCQGTGSPLGGQVNPADDVDDQSTDETVDEGTTLTDPSLASRAGDFNIFLYSSAEQLRREYAWLWSDDTSVAAVNIQTGAQMALQGDDGEYYICCVLALDFDTPYIAYSDWNSNSPLEEGFTITEDQVSVYDRVMFRAYVSPDGDLNHRSAEFYWDGSKVQIDEEHPELGYSVFIWEDKAGDYHAQDDNPYVFFSLNDFLDAVEKES